MIIHKMEQYSPEWWKARAGLPTASIANKILTPTGKFSAQSKGLINTLIAERLGCPDDPMEASEWMIRGTELEPEARSMYEMDHDLDVEQVGFITNDEATAGASPDGLIDVFTDRGGNLTAKAGWECKCPKASTHIGYLLGNELPAYYKPQVHWSMAVSGIRKWVFTSYHPELEPLYIDVEWDDYTESVRLAIVKFTEELATAAKRFGL